MDHGCTYLCIWIRCGAMCLFLRGQRMQCMFVYMHGQNMCFPIYYAAQNLGPVYTTVEKSTGHEKKGISQLWLVENAILDRWVFTLGEENNGGDVFSWMVKWHGPIRGGTFLSWVSPEAAQETPPEKPNSIKNSCSKRYDPRRNCDTYPLGRSNFHNNLSLLLNKKIYHHHNWSIMMIHDGFLYRHSWNNNIL